MVCAWVPGRGCGGVGGVGLRVNGTDSEPIGIYWAIAKPPSKEDFVFALPPAWPIFKLAKEWHARRKHRAETAEFPISLRSIPWP
jgi:hypothetical protein